MVVTDGSLSLTGDVAENEGQTLEGQVPPQVINEGQVLTTSGIRGRRGSRGHGKGSRGGRGGTVGSTEVSENQVSQQVNASQAFEEPLNESQASAKPPTRGRGEDEVMLNPDGSVTASSCGYGGVLWNREGAILGAYTGSSLNRSVTFKELLAVEKGLECALLMNLKKVRVATDSYRAMQIIRAREEVMVARAYVDEHGDEVSHDEVFTHVMKWRDARDVALVARGLPTAYPKEIEEEQLM
ncbi:hypothetical protein IFM89_006496 [Coptis chinensis]|uniref:RNase H type-1 domain-containing protein n=1 Tax=Coptis chinensis TaxID=261450 RepID=A0A835ILC0_9MAGN|nr:hypothetical protein IFM89_006496 [Coptis chinensis]